VPRRDLAQLAALGAIGFAIYQALWTTALGQTTAADSALLIAATPIVTALVAGAIRSDELTPRMLVGAVVSFAGVALVVLAGADSGSGSRAFGNVLTLVAAACWAVYVSFGAPVLRRHSALRTTTWTVAFGTLFLIPLGTWELATGNPHPTIASLLAILYAGILSIAVGNVLQFWGVKTLGPTRTANFQFLVPALAVGLAAVFLAEQIRVEQIVGGIVIVLGIFVARAGVRSRRVRGDPRA
jgi:drug/metabolite transporter (DMT)-like permease